MVTNKQAYDYYLQNKHQEDDVISNIFNKIIYIPANSMDNFNLNHKVSITDEFINKKSILEEKGGKDEGMKEEDEKILNDTLQEKISLRMKLKKYIYFKSHGNWRKARFELSNMIR